MALQPSPRATQLIPIHTRPLKPPQDDLWDALVPALQDLADGDIVVITSKVVAIDQGRCMPVSEVADKEALIASEADAWISGASSRYGMTLAIKESTLIASAGIDESNANGHYVLWPAHPWQAARVWQQRLKAHFGLSRLGVIITDSHCIPLRRGTVGISIGCFGLNPLRDYRGKSDIFGRTLDVTVSNIADAVAAAAVGLMGEGAECIPSVIVRDWPDVPFSEDDFRDSMLISIEEGIFAPLLMTFKNNGAGQAEVLTKL